MEKITQTIKYIIIIVASFASGYIYAKGMEWGKQQDQLVFESNMKVNKSLQKKLKTEYALKYGNSDIRNDGHRDGPYIVNLNKE
jgi:hypothetical protein